MTPEVLVAECRGRGSWSCLPNVENMRVWLLGLANRSWLVEDCDEFRAEWADEA